ncbi:Endochitinase A [Fusarium oxysporum f. sp. albedinis]|nr:Endochitinase A [Fusarium oxysporum f. sp. albedinis]
MMVGLTRSSTPWNAVDCKFGPLVRLSPETRCFGMPWTRVWIILGLAPAIESPWSIYFGSDSASRIGHAQDGAESGRSMRVACSAL